MIRLIAEAVRLLRETDLAAGYHALVGSKLQKALDRSYKKGGFGAMMLQAHEIEAGLEGWHSVYDRKQRLADLLHDIDRKQKLSSKEKFLLHNYRHDLLN